LRQTILQGQSANFLVADLPDSLWKAIFEAQECTSMLIVPIMVQGKCWGQIGFDNCGAPRLFDEAEIAILRIAADSIAAAIERREKDDSLRRSEALYRSLFEISNEGIFRFEFDQPIPLNLSIDEQVDWVYRYFYITQANDAFAAMYAQTRGEDMLGVRLIDIHVEASEINWAFLRALAKDGYRIRNAESEEIDANGRKRYFLNSAIAPVENDCVIGGWGTQIDITELREAQQALLEAERARAELLKTMTTIANHLLRSTDYRLILPDVLQLLGEAARADRCSLVQNITDPASSKSAVRMNAEWCRPGIQASIAHTPELESALLWEEFAELYDRLIQGETVQFFGTDLGAALRELFEAQGNKAMIMVPIVVQGEFWGVFGFDYCGEVRRFEELDQSIFAIAVDSITAAIERQQQDDALRSSNRALQQSYRLLNVIAQITKNLLAAEDADIAIREALQTVGEAASMSRVLLILEQLDPAEHRLKHCVAYEWTASGISTHQAVGLSVMDNEDFQVLNQPFYQGQPIWRALDDLPAVTRSHFERLAIKSTGVVPIFIKGRYIGNIGFDDCVTPRSWSQQEIDVLTAAAESIGAALHRKQLVERLVEERIRAEQERVAELQKINDALQRTIAHLATNPDLDAYLGHVLIEAAEQVGAYSNALFVYDEASNTLAMQAFVVEGAIVDIETDPRMEIWRAPVPADITPGWSRISEQGITMHTEISTDPNQWQFAVPWHLQMGHASAFCVPLRLGDRAIGFMGLCFEEQAKITEEKVALARALTDQATLAIELTRLAEQSRQAAILEERNRIAREIHDTLAQAFTGISIHLGIAHRIAKSQSESVCSLIEQATELAHVGLTEARRSVWELQPNADEYRDLVPLLERVLQQMTSKTAVSAQMQIVGTPYPLPPDVGLNLLRIGQEALTNALKYAQAQSLLMELRFTPEAISLRLEDDGCGFDSTRHTENGGFGLLGMQQRCERLGGELTITSQPGQGTAIVAVVPLVQASARTKEK
jgi:signal transduction histidine kinase/PAS domain-containing protein